MAPLDPSPSIPTRYYNPTNPYPAKKTWPPDLMSMDPKHQFRLERRYRRRAQNAYLRPGWVRGVKFAQYSAVVGILAYSVLWMDWGEEFGRPFQSVRDLFGIDARQSPIDVALAHRRIESALGGRKSSEQSKI